MSSKKPFTWAASASSEPNVTISVPDSLVTWNAGPLGRRVDTSTAKSSRSSKGTGTEKRYGRFRLS